MVDAIVDHPFVVAQPAQASATCSNLRPSCSYPTRTNSSWDQVIQAIQPGPPSFPQCYSFPIYRSG